MCFNISSFTKGLIHTKEKEEILDQVKLTKSQVQEKKKININIMWPQKNPLFILHNSVLLCLI